MASTLADAAERVVRRGRDVGAWSAVVARLASSGSAEPSDFAALMEQEPPGAWEAFAASAFWWFRRAGLVPEDHRRAAEALARAGKAPWILEARRAAAR